MRRRFACLVAIISCLAIFFLSRAHAQASPSEQLQVGPPPTRKIEPPSPDATAEDLEKRGDELRAEKAYPDSLDFFRAALVKKPNSPPIYNKIGIVQLQSYHLPEARKSFERALKLDKKYPDALNNLGVVYYSMKKFGKAIKLYTKAIDLREDSASYFSNLGSAYFAEKQFERASLAYTKALELDPEIFEHTSRTGVTAHLPSPEDRAHYDFVMAKLYAKMGLIERSLQYLRRAMEDGYKDINLVYKDAEFAGLRKDPRFGELMAAKPPAIPN
jgi:tetratricopeptide (TPR) repeat protein